MKKQVIDRHIGVGRCLLAVVMILICSSAVSSSSQVAVIVHRQVAEDSIDQTRLLDFYTGEIRRWDSGARVVPFDLKAKGDTRDRFFEFVGKSSSRMRSIWLKRMLSGEGDPPEALETEDQMISRVATTPGAIGFINKERVNDSVKVLVVIPRKE